MVLHVLSSPLIILIICLITIRNKIKTSIEDRGPIENTDRGIKILSINNDAVADTMQWRTLLETNVPAYVYFTPGILNAICLRGHYICVCFVTMDTK